MSEVKKIATRDSYGNALVELGKAHDDLIVLDADLAGATKTCIFQKEFPERHWDCGIAECNMTGIAAGLATCGKVPFISSFAMFAAGRNYDQVRNSIGYPHLNVKIGATHAGISVGEDGATHQCLEDLSLMREIPGMVVINPSDDVEARAAVKAAYDQVRNSIGYPHLNVKIGATHAGISVGEDGATHQCLEDLSLMREIPGMVVINPSDDVEARAAVKAAYDHVGPVYLRFGRLAVPVINDTPDYKFEIGKGIVLKEGKDVSIFATGLEVSETLEAAKMLAADGIDAEVINIHTIKPIDRELIVKSVSKTGKAVTVEEHSINGGLGSAVAEVLCEEQPAKLLRIGVEDRFGESGPAVELIHKYGLDAEGIYNKVKNYMK